MTRNTTMDQISWVLTAIGAVNWGLVSLADFDLVATIFGERSFLSRIVYGLVGAAGIWSIAHLFQMMGRPQMEREMERVAGMTR